MDPHDPTPPPGGEEKGPAPYSFGPGDGASIAPLLDSAAAALTRMSDGWQAVKRAAEAAGMDTDASLVEEAALIMGYHLRMGLAGEPAGCRLTPMTPAAEHSWPPAIDAVGPDVVSLWREAADNVTHPAAMARLQDLLFERGDDPGGRARTAIGAYLESSATTANELDATESLLRAWELAAKIRDARLHQRARQAMADRADALLGTGERMAGWLFPLLKGLARGPLRQRKAATAPDPIDVTTLLERAMDAYREAPPFLVSELAQIARSVTNDPSAAEQISRDEVGVYLTAAERSSGLMRQTHLANAIDIARRRGLHDLADSAVAQLQRMDVSELGLRRSAVSLTVPRGPIEEWLSGFTRSPYWGDGIAYFLATDPPTGSLDVLRQMEKSLRSASTLSRLMGVQILSASGMPAFSPTNEAEREAYEVASIAKVQADNQGRLLAEGLRRIAERYGIPSEDQLTAFLSHDGAADVRLCSSLCRALRHWWLEDYEAAAHVAFPLTEAAARSLLRELDEGLYRLQRASEPGGYPGLWVLLDALEKIALDESWAYFIRWLLLVPPGMNIRNDLAHGFILDVGPVYSALVIRAAAVLVVLTHPDAPPLSADDGSGSLRLEDEAAQPAASRRTRKELEALLSAPLDAPVTWPAPRPLWAQLGGLLSSMLRLSAAALDAIVRVR